MWHLLKACEGGRVDSCSTHLESCVFSKEADPSPSYQVTLTRSEKVNRPSHPRNKRVYRLLFLVFLEVAYGAFTSRPGLYEKEALILRLHDAHQIELPFVAFRSL